MSEEKKELMKQVAAALDFGTSKVVCLVGELTPYRIEVLGLGTCEYAGFNRGKWNEPENLEKAVYAAVREAEIQSRHKVRSLHVGIPGEFLKVVSGRLAISVAGKDKRISQHDVDRLLQAAGKAYSPDRYKALHRSALYYITDNRPVVSEPVGIRSSKLGAVMSYVLADMLFMSGVSKLLDGLALTAEQYVAVPYAIGQFQIPDESRALGAVLVDVGYLSTDVSIFQGKGIVYQETLPMGGGHITSDIAYCMEVSFEAAEKIKRRFVYGMIAEEGERMTFTDGDRVKRLHADKLQQVVEARTDEIIDAVQRMIRHCGYHMDERTIIYLTGGGFNLMRASRHYIDNRLELKVKLLSPNMANLDSPVYSSAAAVLEYGLMQDEEPEEESGFFAAIRRWFRSLFE